MGKKDFKKDVVTKTILKLATKREDGLYDLPEPFMALLENKGRARETTVGMDSCWKIAYGKIVLFGAWTDDLAHNKVLNDHIGRHIPDYRFNIPEGYKFKASKGTEELPRGCYLLLSTQFGSGNLPAFCDLIRVYEKQEKKEEGSLLSSEDAKFLCASSEKNRTGRGEYNGHHDFPSRNCIVFGAPGTGKSKYFEDQRKKKKREVLGPADNTDNNDTTNGFGEEAFFTAYKRVTFYPTYSYAQFIGTYKPVMRKIDEKGIEIGDQNAEGKFRKTISYQFTPGPFLEILKDALLDRGNNYLLIIEEINRANAAAVFGDMFQLLDRDDKGTSDYSISPSEEIVEYLMLKDKEGKGGLSEKSAHEIRIPSNLYIWATMNSADQGVFPLDTAFKRRWNFKYRPLDGGKDNNDSAEVRLCNDTSCKWGEFRRAINHLLSRNGVNEDKLLSSFFVKGNSIDTETFEMKVLMYLWEDAARMCRSKVFKDGINTFSALLEKIEKVKGGEDEDKKNEVDFETVFRFEGREESVGLKYNKPEPQQETDTKNCEPSGTNDGEAQNEATEQGDASGSEANGEEEA